MKKKNLITKVSDGWLTSMPDRFRVEHRREIPSISAAQFFLQ